MAKKEKKELDFFLREVSCGKCGKTFVPTYSWVYKETRKDKTQYYCTWTCFNHRERGRAYRWLNAGCSQKQ